MTTITIPKEKLKNIVKESVREIFEQESMKFRALFLPFISQKEQRDIEKRYGKPFQKKAKTIKIKL